MYTSLRYAVMTVQLADKRVLLYRKNHGGWPQWAVTHESFLSHHESPLVEINKILMNNFGIDPSGYNDKFAEIKQLGVVETRSNRCIYPFLAKIHRAFSFTSMADCEYKAVLWHDLLKDMDRESLRSVQAQKYTPTSKSLVKALNRAKVID